MFEELEVDALTTTEVYRYILFNASAASGIKMKLVPTPQQSITGGLKVYYLRGANKLTEDASICDIPEFKDYVVQFMRYRCRVKESHPDTPIALEELKFEEQQLISTLKDMTPDGDNEIDMDLSIYDEMGIQYEG